MLGENPPIFLLAFFGAVLAEVKIPAVDSDNGKILRLVMALLGNLGSSCRHRSGPFHP
jgi:hypothetical protein